jgi:hypothetical protein
MLLGVSHDDPKGGGMLLVADRQCKGQRLLCQRLDIDSDKVNFVSSLTCHGNCAPSAEVVSVLGLVPACGLICYKSKCATWFVETLEWYFTCGCNKFGALKLDQDCFMEYLFDCKFCHV